MQKPIRQALITYRHQIVISAPHLGMCMCVVRGVRSAWGGDDSNMGREMRVSCLFLSI